RHALTALVGLWVGVAVATATRAANVGARGAIGTVSSPLAQRSEPSLQIHWSAPVTLEWGIGQAPVIIERDLVVALAALDQQVDRRAAVMRCPDRLAETVVRILPSVDREDHRARGGAGLEHRPAPGDRADPPALADRGADR